ncbi:NAD(P)/FAD-dependent oxidoreductase [archaeon]|nr:NAD(P)/FAD-dependent oxidoreductase [archaeon]
MKVSIIGGGVAGTSSALKLAEKIDPENITLIEKKPHFKKACSGILTYAKDELIKIPNHVIKSKVNKFRIYSPNNQVLELNFKKPDTVCERELLNEYLTKEVEKKGVKILQPAVLEKINNNSITVNSKEIPTTHLIGADGFNSTVAKLTGLSTNKNYFVGAKAIVEKEHDNAIEVYPNYGCFAWAVPHGDGQMEVGSMSHPHQGAVFNRFLKKFECKVLSQDGALIPLHNPFVKTYKKNGSMQIYLVGDAAGMVKATTGGSIIQSFVSSQLVANSIINNKKFSWRRKLGFELFAHLMTRKFLDKFKEKDWDEFISMLNTPSIKEVLETETRDNIKYLLPKILFKKPSLIKYALKIF